MQLTTEQVVKMQSQGLGLNEIESLAKQKGYQMPQQRDVLNRVGDVINKIFPGKQVGQSIGTLAGLGLSKLRGTSQFYDTSAPKVSQVLGDVVQGGAMLAGARLPIAKSITGKALQFGGLGAVSGGSSATASGKSAQEIGEATRKGLGVGLLTGFTFGVLEKGAKALGQGLSKTGEKIQYSVIKPSQQDIKDGFSINTIRKYGLGGSLNDTMKKTDVTLDDLAKQLNKKLTSTNASVDLSKVYENTSKKLLGEKLSGFGANKQMSSALEKLKEEIVYTVGENGLTTIPQAQVIKRASGHFGAWQYGLQTPEATASQRVYNTFYNALKTEIEKASPTGVRELNKQISELIPVMNAVIRRIPVAQRNQALSLTDIITLTGAAIDPRAMGLTALNLASKSGKVGNILAGANKLGERVSSGLGGLERLTRTFQQGGR